MSSAQLHLVGREPEYPPNSSGPLHWQAALLEWEALVRCLSYLWTVSVLDAQS